MEVLSNIVNFINTFLWDFLLLILLCGTGIYFTFKLRFVQIRKFKEGLKQTFGGMFKKTNSDGKSGISSFQAVATSIAAQVGTGNLAGAATAIISGGPGAIFWMWVSAFFGMATIFSEATLAQTYKTVKDGEVTGGPSYYIKAAFKGKFGKILAATFSVLIVIALGFAGNMVQANSIGASFKTAFNINPLIIGIVVAALAGLLFFGGVKKIAKFAETVVPFMAILYIFGSLIVVITNITNVPEALKSIIVGAFSPGAIGGAFAGLAVKEAIRFGVARGLFSNEAGMGSTPHAHAIAKVDHPCQQGVVSIICVFIDTFVILTLTALTILSTNVTSGNYKGVELTQAAFESVFGRGGTIFIAICMFFFAFSTIVGWYFFGEANVRYLFGKKAVWIYTLLVMGFIVLGSFLKVDIVWALSDMFNGLMVIPNLLGVLALGGVVSSKLKDYEKLQKDGKLKSR